MGVPNPNPDTLTPAWYRLLGGRGWRKAGGPHFLVLVWGQGGVRQARELRLAAPPSLRPLPAGVTGILATELFDQMARPAAYMVCGALMWTMLFLVGLVFPFLVVGLPAPAPWGLGACLCSVRTPPPRLHPSRECEPEGGGGSPEPRGRRPSQGLCGGPGRRGAPWPQQASGLSQPPGGLVPLHLCAFPLCLRLRGRVLGHLPPRDQRQELRGDLGGAAQTQLPREEPRPSVGRPRGRPVHGAVARPARRGPAPDPPPPVEPLGVQAWCSASERWFQGPLGALCLEAVGRKPTMTNSEKRRGRKYSL